MLRRVESKWTEIAGAFNLPSDLIQQLQQQCSGSEADYQSLVEVCEAWISQDRESPPTWKDVAEVIKTIGCVDIAKEMLNIYAEGT